jgi:hypothetical protein
MIWECNVLVSAELFLKPYSLVLRDKEGKLSGCEWVFPSIKTTAFLIGQWNFRHFSLKISMSFLFKEMKVHTLTGSFGNKNLLIWIEKKEVETKRRKSKSNILCYQDFFFGCKAKQNKQKKWLFLSDSGVPGLTILSDYRYLHCFYFIPSDRCYGMYGIWNGKGELLSSTYW